MSFERFLAEGRLRQRRTRRDDIQHLLRLNHPPLLCWNETHGAGHHWVIFQLLPHFMGEATSELATYFESCRTKRNVGTYDRGREISDTEAGESSAEVNDFKTQVERWLRAVHPEYS